MSERIYTIAVGRSRFATDWLNREATWDGLKERLARVKRTAETAAQYAAMSHAQRGKAKDVGGFVGGALDGGRRTAGSVRSRSLVTLDIDSGSASAPDIIADMLGGTAWALYSTHSHTAASPRFRLVVPLSRDVTADEYVPIARRVADWAGIGMFDPSTYEPSRLMYWPSCPKDGEFVFRSGDGAPLDADKALGSYDDWRDTSEWPLGDGELAAPRAHGARQEDPTAKAGVIGAFCRAYTVEEAMETFLPGVYVPTDTPGRWTYAAGSTTGGLVVYGDGMWAYSHHGSDPAGGRLCNAFDLVRIHRFGGEDAGASPDTPANRLPSFTAMERLARSDRRVTGLMAEEKARALEDDFAKAGTGDAPDAPAGGGGKDGKDGKGTDGREWTRSMQMDERRRNFLPSPYNFGLIIRNDPGLKGRVRRDLFRGRDAVTADLPWRKAGDGDPWWNNSDDNGLIDYVSRRYALTGKQALLDAQDLAASQSCFHPVRDWLRTLEWDGTPRLDALLHDYLGAADSPVVRAMTRKHFCAAVARVMRPGVKYDYVLTLIGPEGIGKSSLIRAMGMGRWYDDSFTTIEGKEGMEQLRGKWLVELGELTNYKKSTSEAYKAFISKQEDSYRPAYGRKTEVYPRQCVFFATTNERAFLKGDTGNRRFWTVECGLETPARDVWRDLPQEAGQVWAEARARWEAGEQLWLPRDLETEARRLQEGHNEVADDERRGMIEEFIRKPVPASWPSMTADQRRDWWRMQSGSAPADGEPRVRRETVCAVEVLVELFGQRVDEHNRYRTREINQMLRGMPGLEYIGLGRVSCYGVQRRFRILWDKMEDK